MATLEKIRSKSGLLIVVIGLALLAFIIGDALTNGRNLFGDTTTVAKIGSEKIDYHEYQRKREELNSQLEEAKRNNPQAQGYDVQLLPQLAVDQLIMEKLIESSIKNLGITASGEQLRYYMMEQPMNQNMGVLLSQLRAAGLNVTTPQQAYEIIFNPKRNGLTDADVAPMQRAWLALEAETAEMIKRNTYQRLLVNSIRPNELDKKALYNDYVAVSNVDYAFKPFGTLDEKKYPVTDAEINARYNEDKNLYRIDEPMKSVGFISVSVTPSDADRQEARRIAAETVEALRDSAGQLPKSLRGKGVSLERKELRLKDVPAGAVRNYVQSAPKDSVSILREDVTGFTALRMGRRTSAVDSIQINTVAVAGATLPGRVLAMLESGAALDSIQKKFSPDSVQVQKDQWIQLFTAQGRVQGMQQSQIDTLLNAGAGYVKLLDSPQGTLFAQVVKRNAPVEICEYEEISYQLNPSTATVNDAREKLRKFLAQNNTADKFMANAEKAGYTVTPLEISQSTPAIQRYPGSPIYYPNSRQVVRWAMIDGEKNEVSKVYESKDAKNPMLYAVAISDEYEDFVPATNKDVRADLEDKVRRAKAGDDLVKQYTGKGASVQQVAQAMQVDPTTGATLRMGRNGGLRDLAVVGKIMGSKAGQPVVVVKGDNGVYVYKVNSSSKESFEYNDDSYNRQYMQQHQPSFDRMIRGTNKFKNNVYKFEAGE